MCEFFTKSEMLSKEESAIQHCRGRSMHLRRRHFKFFNRLAAQSALGSWVQSRREYLNRHWVKWDGICHTPLGLLHVQMSHKSKQRLSGFFSPLVFNNELIIYVLTFNPFFQGRGGKWEYITAVIRSGLGKTTIHTVIYVRIHTSGQFRVNILFLDCWRKSIN